MSCCTLPRNINFLGCAIAARRRWDGAGGFFLGGKLLINLHIYIHTYIHTYTNIVNIAKKCAYEELQWSSLFIVAMKTGTLPPGILNVGTDEMLTNPDCINFSA